MYGATETSEIHSAALEGMGSLAAELGVDLCEVLRRHGIPPDLNALGKRVRLSLFAELLEDCAFESGDECFALRLASEQEPTQAGAIAYAMKNAPTVQDGLVTMIRFIRTCIDTQHIELITDGGRSTLEWSISPMIGRRTQLTDFVAVSISRKIAFMLDSESWRPRGVRLERPIPKTMDLHREILGPTQFEQRTNSIAFDTATLNLPLVEPDPQLHSVAIDLLKRMASERGPSTDLLKQCREEFIWGLENGEAPQLNCLANRLGMSARTLQRELTELGATFQTLLDETRHVMAKHYLETTKLPLSQIGFRLGFSSPSAFTRACRRWFGASPSQVRRHAPSVHKPGKVQKG